MSWNSRTNRISIIWVNHNGWIDIFVIKNYFFCSYFRHISLCFYLNFEHERSLDAKFNSPSNKYPHWILLVDLATLKTRIPKKTRNTIMVYSFYWNSIGSWIPTHKNLLLARFFIRPILDPKFTLMFLFHSLWRSFKIKFINASNTLIGPGGKIMN